jgi:hypothetical protein
MASLALAVGIASLAGVSSAQTSGEHVWSSVAFTLYGDRTPMNEPTPPSLTPLGAQQLHAQGSMFRARYLNSSLTDSENAVTIHVGIEGIEKNAIDNSQLYLLAAYNSYTSAGAQAFMQGLYPPIAQAFPNGTGGIQAAELADGSVVNYPLGGYQYPNINVASTVDSDSVW